MARKYPPARWRPIERNFTNRVRTETRGVILHSTGSATATSQFGWFNNPAADASSHLHLDVKGRWEQYVDLDKIAWTSGAGNTTTIGVETQGDGTTAWNDAQVLALVRFLRWAAKKYRFPLRTMSSSLPTQTGVGTHRLGVRGNFPTRGVQRGLIQRGKGEQWSSDFGKVCPGDKRQAQWPDIVRAAQRHRVVLPTLGRTGAATYLVPETGKKNLSRVLTVGRIIRISEFHGKWALTAHGDWIKRSKIKGKKP